MKALLKLLLNRASIRYFLCCAFLIGNLFPLCGVAGEKELPLLGGMRVVDPVAVHGGSYDPMHNAHLDNVVFSLESTGIDHAVVIPTKPYKKTASPAATTLRLTRFVINKMRSFLEKRRFYFRNYSAATESSNPAQGQAQWDNRSGSHKTVTVDDFEMRSANPDDHIPANTLTTLRYLRDHYGAGDARRIFWFAGEDNIPSLPSWKFEDQSGKDAWQQVFQHVNWVFLSRPGVKDGINFNQVTGSGPLQGHFPHEFLARYNYRFDQKSKTHIYEEKLGGPSIFILNKKGSDRSSSRLKKSFSQSDPEKAREGLEQAQEDIIPELFDLCVTEKLYLNRAAEKVSAVDAEKTNEIYESMTRENLVSWIRWKFRMRIENASASGVGESEQQRFWDSVAQLLSAAENERLKAVESQKGTPAYKGLISKIAEGFGVIAEHVQELRWSRLKKTFREMEQKFRVRRFVMAVVAAEIIEQTVAPPAFVYIFGLKGLALVPFFHPNEMFVIPGYLAWNSYKSWRALSYEKRKMIEIAGSEERYGELLDLARRLQHGDSKVIRARFELLTALGLNGSALRFHVVESKFPKWVPYSLRQAADRQNTWHDLNVSINELRAMLGNDEVYEDTKKIAGDDRDLLASLLVQSIYQGGGQNLPALKLQLLLSHRFFRQMVLGDMPEELLSQFAKSDRELIGQMKVQSEHLNIKSVLSNRQVPLWKDLIADFYSIVRLSQVHPGILKQDGFWTTFIDLMMTRYPDQKANWKDDRQAGDAILRIQTLAELLMQYAPESMKDVVIRYDSEELLKIKDSRIVVSQNRAGRIQTSARADYVKVLEVSSLYIAGDQMGGKRIFGDLKTLPSELQSPTIKLEPRYFNRLSTNSRFAEESENESLYMEMVSYASSVRARIEDLLSAFFESTTYELYSNRKEKALFRSAMEKLEARMKEKDQELRFMTFEWLNVVDQYRYSKDVERAGYQEMKDRYQVLQSHMNAMLESLENLIHMLSGQAAPAPSSLTDLNEMIRRQLQSCALSLTP